MPFCSTALIDSSTSWSLSSSLSDSSLIRMSCDSATVTRRVLVRPPPSLPKMSPIEIAPICAPGMPGISNSGMPPPDDCTSISISLSLSSPARSFLRKASLVVALAFSPTSASTTRSSAASWARACTSLRFLLPRLRDRDFDEIAHDLLDVAADIADLGELGGLDLDEGGAGELGEAAGNLGLADAGRADHQDVLGQHLLAQLLVELQAPPAVAQRDRDRALGVALADDEAVELGDDFARGKVGHDGGIWPWLRTNAIALHPAAL